MPAENTHREIFLLIIRVCFSSDKKESLELFATLSHQGLRVTPLASAG
jgi:hypothetical protein